MFTIEYKGWYINGYFDRSECKVIMPNGGLWCRANSIHGAKILISKAIKWVKVKT